MRDSDAKASGIFVASGGVAQLKSVRIAGCRGYGAAVCGGLRDYRYQAVRGELLLLVLLVLDLLLVLMLSLLTCPVLRACESGWRGQPRGGQRRRGLGDGRGGPHPRDLAARNRGDMVQGAA